MKDTLVQKQWAVGKTWINSDGDEYLVVAQEAGQTSYQIKFWDESQINETIMKISTIDFLKGKTLKEEVKPKKISNPNRKKFRSEFRQAIACIQDGLEAITLDNAEELISNAKDELESIGSECQDKFDNLPEGLQQGHIGQLLQERAEACSDLVLELEGLNITEDPFQQLADLTWPE